MANVAHGDAPEFTEETEVAEVRGAARITYISRKGKSSNLTPKKLGGKMYLNIIRMEEDGKKSPVLNAQIV